MSDLLSPDNSVRTAGPADVLAVGAVHARSWTGPYAQVLPPSVVSALTADALADAWRDSISSPPTPDHRVLVAVGDGIVAGFAAAAPTDTHGVLELVSLEVDPLHTRRGHGSRLLAAVVDTAQARGWTQLQVWVHQDDAVRLAFLRGAGLGEDGARRRRGLGSPGPADELDSRTVWPEVRLVGHLGPPPPG